MSSFNRLYMINISKTQIGSYYRGAGLCYMETLNNYLDSASCFFIAGNYYFDAKKFLNAATNYEDGARMFEYLKNFKKVDLSILHNELIFHICLIIYVNYY